AADFYTEKFADCKKVITPVTSSFSTHSFHQYTLKLVDVDREKLMKGLKEKGIPSMIYYPIPLHLQKAYQDERYKAGDFPVAEKLSECVVSLPMHTELDNEQLNYITEKFLKIIADC
ncbi:MAG: DegT/DnrJ/EryC1/StrS family aminotransferase, partial [Prevotellaceae bacterium]|nr:DegT/DnrJ/EryC1/StrS family aminotransferase [Prevotellaceae bacterium]